MATLRVTMKQRLLQQEIRNTFHFAGGDAVQSNAQGIIDYLASLWSTHLSGLLTPNWELYGGSAKELDIVSNPTIEYGLTGGNVQGTNLTDMLPTQVAKLVTWVALTARPNRGRTYLAGYCEDLFGPDGLFVGSAISNTALWAQGVIDIDATYPGLAFTVTRVDRATGTLVGSNIIETFRNRANPAIQRSRRIGQGI